MTSGYDSVVRITTGISIIIAFLVACVVPAAYFAMSYQYKVGSLDAEVKLTSRRVEGLILANPTMWQYEEVRLQELLQHRHEEETSENWLIRDMQGNVIARVSNPVSRPQMSHSREIYDAGSPVAVIEVSQPLLPLLMRTALVSFFSFAVGIAIYYVLRTLPLKSLRQAYHSLEDKERELHLSEQRYRFMYNHTPAMLHSIDRDGRLISVSNYWLDVMGYERDEVLGRRSTEFLSEASRRHAIEVILPEFMKTGECRDVEYQFVKKNGEVIDTLLSGTSERDVGGHVMRSLAIIQDVTKRKKAEDALRKRERYQRALLDNFPFSVWLKDTEGRFLAVNKMFARIFGAHDADELQGKSDFDVTSHDSAQRYQAEDAAVLSSRQQKIVEEEIDDQGVCRSFEIFRAPVIDENGELLGTVGFSRDITEHKEHEKELIRIEKLESLGILAGGIAHDFNNIITGIMGNISFARKFLDATHKSFALLSEAERASVRARELAQQLLTFSRGGEPVKKVVSVQDIVNESVSLMMRGSNVRAVVDIPASVHAVDVDEGQISQAFNNLILNALQAMPGGGTLSIAAQNETVDDRNTLGLSPGAYVSITFADQGCGIPDADLLRIFDPYFSTKTAGRGLGLASVYSIVNRHGGHIGVTSAIRKGTTFKIFLPSGGEICSRRQPDAVASIAGDHQGGNILVMDDEKAIRNLAGELLTYLGYQVQTCVNGEEAIACYKTAGESGTPFSAVVMDLTIPGGMGGREAAQHILALDPEALLIVSSGYSNDPIMADYRAFGFGGAITKPYKVDDLSRILSSLLQGKSAKFRK